MEFDWSPIRLAVFDVDGTLYRQKPLRARMAAELALAVLQDPKQVKSVIGLQRFRSLRDRLAERPGASLAEIEGELIPSALGLSPDRLAAITDEWLERRPLRHLSRYRFEQVEDLFQALRESGRTIAVFSDYPAESKLAAMGLRSDICVSARDTDVDRLKPDPAGLQKILRLSGFGPDQAVMIGDRPERDGACAQQLGVRFWLRSDSAGPETHSFGNYADLLSALKSANT